MKTRIKRIKATPNRSARTFTLRIYYNDNTMSKYRTEKMTKVEFEDSIYNVFSDWVRYLVDNESYIYLGSIDVR